LVGLIAALLLASLALAPPTTTVRAGTDTVTNCSGNAATVGSLPNVFNAVAAGDTIVFAQDCTATANSVITLTSPLTASKSVTINATVDGRSVTVSSGGGAVRLLQVNSGVTLGLLGLTLTGGNSGNGSGGAISNSGGNVAGITDGSSGITNGTNNDKAGTAANPLNPLLGPLASNDGPVQTFALLPGLPAIGRLLCPMTLITYARGVSRPQPAGGNCDAGSFESRSFTVGTLAGNSQNALVNAAFATPVDLTVTSAMGEPVAGGQVTFTITPGVSGASATFGTASGCTNTSATVSVCTVAANGTVASPPFTANTVLGGLTIVATATGVPPTTFTEAVGPPLVLPAGPLQNAGPGVPYRQTLTATGGTGMGYTYALATGSSLPPGLMLAALTGTISGTTPPTPGTYSFSITVTDSGGTTTSRTYTITVAVPNATLQAAVTQAAAGMPPAPAPVPHAPGAAPVRAGVPTPLSQPVRH